MEKLSCLAFILAMRELRCRSLRSMYMYEVSGKDEAARAQVDKYMAKYGQVYG